MNIEPHYFRPNKRIVNILIVLYIISILTYYLTSEEKSQCISNLLVITLPLAFTILFVIATRQVIISEHTITVRRFGGTYTTSFYKIKSVEYRKSFWRGGRYMAIRYTDQIGSIQTMKVYGDYDLQEISDIIENGRRIV